MTQFLTALRAQTNTTYTENGAITNRSSFDPVVDFFALAGGMRDNPARAADLFADAFAADPQTAVRTLFYLRDIRGGQGERDVFRAGLAWLRDNVPTAYFQVVELVPEYGRWDDVLHPGVARDGYVLELIGRQLNVDLLNYGASAREPVSLLAKWLPSENTSSQATRELAATLRMAMGLTAPQYRRILSKLRGRIRLLEHDMSSNNWENIDYAKLPSQAHRKHVAAFERHTPERYAAYLASVERGEAKINTAALYPYEVYDMACAGKGSAADVMWANLPDYTNGKNALVMADVSGSMWGRPMSVSVSLALYFAERNEGPFNGHFLTFSGDPQLVKVQGTNLRTRLHNIESANWGMNTDLMKAFRSILAAAIRSDAAPPSVLYVISDMEFDQATTGNQETVFALAQTEFARAGYELPHVVFWNVNARSRQVPATILDGRVSLVSGCSPTVFGMAVEGKSARELVDAVVNSERYNRIVL